MIISVSEFPRRTKPKEFLRSANHLALFRVTRNYVQYVSHYAYSRVRMWSETLRSIAEREFQHSGLNPMPPGRRVEWAIHGSLAILLLVVVVLIVSVAAGGPSRAGRKRGQTKVKIAGDKRNAEDKAKRQRAENDGFWSKAFGRSKVGAEGIRESSGE